MKSRKENGKGRNKAQQYNSEKNFELAGVGFDATYLCFVSFQIYVYVFSN